MVIQNQNENGNDEGEGYNIPLKERELYTQINDPPIKDLCDRINKGRIEVKADFQREYVWETKPELKSKLIESVFLKVPIPVVYTAELKDGKEVVIDGQQRLRTFLEFCKKDGFKLSRLKILENLNGKSYTQLPPELQEKVDSYPIRVVKILKESHPDIKFDIFERLNRGSVKLSDQELRNCIYRGKFNFLLKMLAAGNQDFLQIQNLKEPHKRMKDVERVLRFLAFCDRGIQNYKSPIKGFLNDYMEEKRDIEDSEAKEKAERFKKCVELVKVVFGDLAGRRWQAGDEEDPNGELSSLFNEGIFDAQMVGFMDYTKHDIIPNAQVIKDVYLDLISGDRKFIETVEIATYDTKQTKKRMETWLRKLREVADYPSGDRRFYTFEEKESIFKQKSGNICQICRNEIMEIDDAHVDHIERFSEGGKTTLKNAQLTHRYCNLAKG
ncbi:DUF262 domain-containing protein [Candidatus Woesearchaeota archaeon]|nr:DUF262 domain-containing protein [Candidatus Woesearchaeota archaeon]